MKWKPAENTHHTFSTKCCDLIFDYWKNPFNWNKGFIWWCLCWHEQFEEEHNTKMMNKEQLIYVIKIKVDYSNQPISHEEGWWTDQGWLADHSKENCFQTWHSQECVHCITDVLQGFCKMICCMLIIEMDTLGVYVFQQLFC